MSLLAPLSPVPPHVKPRAQCQLGPKGGPKSLAGQFIPLPGDDPPQEVGGEEDYIRRTISGPEQVGTRKGDRPGIRGDLCNGVDGGGASQAWGHWHFIGKSSDFGTQMFPPTHTQDTLWPIALGTPLVICDLTPNNDPDDNMNIKDKSQEPQTCAGPQGKEEGSFQGWAAPGCSHTTLPAPTPPQFCILALPSPAILPSNSYCPSKSIPKLPSPG